MVCAMLLSLLPVVTLAASIPGDVLAYFSSSKFDDYTIVDSDEIDDYCFVVIRGTGKNKNTYVYGFKQNKSGDWKYWMHNNGCVPQGDNDVSVNTWYGYTSPITGKSYSYPCVEFYQDTTSGYRSVLFCLVNGVWKRCRYVNTAKDTYVAEANDTVCYFKDEYFSSKKGTLTASLQRDIRYTSLSSIPATYSAAKETLTSAPEIPYSAELQPEQVNFTGKKTFPVYSAPSSSSLRGANGKAAVSTNGWIQVFGVTNGWVLIQYSISASQMRFGYIEASSLPKNADVSALLLTDIECTLLRTVDVTDDPLYSCNSIATLQQGATVTKLAEMGTWAYIEYRGSSYFRGFVPLSAISDEGGDSVG